MIAMKKVFILSTILVSALLTNAGDLYQQLVDFNPNWENYQSHIEGLESTEMPTDWDYVQTHLTHVLPILRNNPTDHLTAEQLEMRLELIEVLQFYRDRKVFPINYYVEERIPVFIDEHNTHCAVGYLMKNSGHQWLANKISIDNNYAWVKEIEVPELMDWQELSGFTVEELKLIQGAYDFYMPGALFAPNKYEIPQQPDVMVHYFEDKLTGLVLSKKEKNIWCYGEGEDGVLNGIWIQNYDVGVPWIEGYYENGNRTGKWKEYYPGTNKLCRTEHWREDKLNGLRKRYDMEGKLIEEIMFKDGEAVIKTNYDLMKNMTYIRTPLDSNSVWTQVYTSEGGLMAEGEEVIHNPGNLQWFQNIELTALNSFGLEAQSPRISLFGGNNYGGNDNFNPVIFSDPSNVFRPLVTYKKEGKWIYHREFQNELEEVNEEGFYGEVIKGFPTLHSEFLYAIYDYEIKEYPTNFQAVQVVYKNNQPTDIVAHSTESHVHLHMDYFDNQIHLSYPGDYYFLGDQTYNQIYMLSSIGLMDIQGNKIGTWKIMDERGVHFMDQTYLVPWKEEENDLRVEN